MEMKAQENHYYKHFKKRSRHCRKQENKYLSVKEGPMWSEILLGALTLAKGQMEGFIHDCVT